MARIFITGSADGLGHLAAKACIGLGHRVVLHARNTERGEQAMKKAPGAEGVLVADLADLEATKEVAEKANASGAFDAVIHNAGVYRVPKDSVGAQGFSLLLTVNTLAPYLLTCLMHRPKRLVYMSSGMHLQGNPEVSHLARLARNGGNAITYSDTKLHDLILSMAVARKWKDVFSNAVNPGWVPTKMGGAGAPDSLHDGVETQVWLATDEGANVSGSYFRHKRKGHFLEAANDTNLQDQLLQCCAELTGVEMKG